MNKHLFLLVVVVVFSMLAVQDMNATYDGNYDKMIISGQELEYEPGEVIICIDPSVMHNFINEPGYMNEFDTHFNIPSLDAVTAKYGLIYIDPMQMDNMYQLEFSEETDVAPIIAELQKLDCVTFAGYDLAMFNANFLQMGWRLRNRPRPTADWPNDPLFADQHHHRYIQSLEMWEKNKDREGAEVTVCVVDTGMDYDHPDLNPNMNKFGGNYGYDAFSHTNDPKNRRSSESHATHCGGIVSAAFNNGIGGTGMGNKIRLRSYRGLNEYGSGTLESLVDAMTEAVRDSVKINNARETPHEIAGVFNMSWGTRATVPEEMLKPIKDVVDYAKQNKIFMVAAAGNEDYPAAGYPARWVLAVAATGYYENDDGENVEQRAYFSSYGEGVEMCAPGDGMTRGYGDGILSTMPDGKYARMRGTSMASPVVAGCAAAIISQHTQINMEQLEEVLVTSGDEVGCDVHIGLRVNIDKAMDAADAIMK